MEEIEKEEIQVEKKKRGRQKGVLVGPRPTAWVGAAVKDGKVIIDLFTAPLTVSPEERESFSIDDAKIAFELKYGVNIGDISMYSSPLYEKKGTNTKTITKPPATKDIKTKQIEFSKIRKGAKLAVFDSWSGLAHSIEDDDNTSYFIFIKDLLAQNNKSRTPPQPVGVLNQYLTFKDSDTIIIPST